MNPSDDCLGVVGSCASCGNPVLEYLCNQPFWEHREASRSHDFSYAVATSYVRITRVPACYLNFLIG